MPKLHFFVFITNYLKPFLTTHLTDATMIPFLYSDLLELMAKIFKVFIKPEVFEDKDRSEIQKLDFS